ncbi:helix-turn-helix transcriptional regulator [Thermobifida halotolerans]|uniref:helix-turn-helix transcriptional regulator n=1 Tax=Thermobifida halotolerans TaxID=483545 RepID=UPI000AD209F9|nr:AraC family transcriptional regulator [Thermobifida halotolerans]
MREAIQQAVLSIHKRYFDPLTLNSLASEVFVSPYHFSRVFSKTIGVTPGRYLSAIRLFEAKRLLLTTSLTVSDIVCSVGYNSVGTFTSRFTQEVGMSPTQYRRPDVRELVLAVSPDFQRLPPVDLAREAKKRNARNHPGGGSIEYTVELPPWAGNANVLVGVFADPIPQCAPVACQAWTGTGTARLLIEDVPVGHWVAIAVAEPVGGAPGSGEVLIGDVRHPVAVTAGHVTRLGVQMRRLQPVDPPIAVTLASSAFPRQANDGVERYYERQQAAA